jgi:hypothetical protein
MPASRRHHGEVTRFVEYVTCASQRMRVNRPAAVILARRPYHIRMSMEGLRALRARVAAEPDLALRLRCVSPERFVAQAASVAVTAGCDVNEEDLLAAIAQGRTAWLLRWIM